MKSNDAAGNPMLTHRESEIFDLYAEGFSSSQIAKQLCISARTVETHRFNLMQKLDLHSPNELANFARKQGILAKSRITNYQFSK
jgi:DNA-binding NarL/FixJ family response regulator